MTLVLASSEHWCSSFLEWWKSIKTIIVLNTKCVPLDHLVKSSSRRTDLGDALLMRPFVSRGEGVAWSRRRDLPTPDTALYAAKFWGAVGQCIFGEYSPLGICAYMHYKYSGARSCLKTVLQLLEADCVVWRGDLCTSASGPRCRLFVPSIHWPCPPLVLALTTTYPRLRKVLSSPRMSG